jgi:diguanylate cyclase (GGDEF)-like protein
MEFKGIDNYICKKIIKQLSIAVAFSFAISINTSAVEPHSTFFKESFEHLELLSKKNPKLALDAAKKILIEKENDLTPADKITLFAKLAQYSYFINNIEQSQQYVEQAYLLEPNFTNDTGISLLITRAALLTNNNKLEKAKTLYLQAEKNAIATENNQRLAEVYSFIADFYQIQHNDIQALQYFHKSYLLLEKLGNELELMYLKSQMSAAYSNLFDDENAIKLANEALAYFLQRQLYFDALYAQDQLATSYFNAGQYEKAKAAFESLVELSKLTNDNDSLTMAYLGLANIYFTTKQYKKSHLYLQKFHTIKPLSLPPYTVINYLFLETSLALLDDNTAVAQQHISDIETLIAPLNEKSSLSWKVHLLTIKAELSSMIQDYKAAYIFEKEARKLHSSYQNTQRETLRSKYKVLFDTDQANLKNKILERDNLLDKAALNHAEQQRWLQYLITIFSLTVILFLIFIFKKQVRKSKKLNKLANTDALTGLANRRFVFNYAEHKLVLDKKYNQPFALIIFDIDHFKSVNDLYGHTGGDIALISIAKIANEYVRNQDILGRIGGEEFLLVLPKTSTIAALAVAQRIRIAIEENDFLINDKHVRITASFGVAQLSDQEDFSHIFQCADKALYQAKASGRNLVKTAEGVSLAGS